MFEGSSELLASSINAVSWISESNGIRIQTPNLTLKNAATIYTSTFDGQAGDIEIVADDITIDGGYIDASYHGAVPDNLVTLYSEQFGIDFNIPKEQGKCGNIVIQANNNVQLNAPLTVYEIDEETNQTARVNKIANITTQNAGDAVPGYIQITSNIIEMDKGFISSSSTGANAGDAGNILISAKEIRINNGSLISSGTFNNAAGNGGELILNAEELLLIDNGKISTQTEAEGDAGNITVDSRNVNIINSGYISASSQADASGNAGSINISADEKIIIESSGNIKVSTSTVGNGGNLSLNTQILEINGGTVNGVTTDQGNGADIDIHVTELKMSYGNIISGATATSSGTGGDVIIHSDDSVVLSESSVITASMGEGDSGLIHIDTGELKVDDNSIIGNSALGAGRGNDIEIDVGLLELNSNGNIMAGTHSESSNAVGSNIIIKADESVRISDNSFINVGTGGNADAGYIDIRTPGLFLENRSFIDSSTAPYKAKGVTYNNISGMGGNIFLQTEFLGIDNGSFIMAGCGPGSLGKGGDIEIKTDTLRLNNSLGITSQSEGEGPAGNINLTVNDTFTINSSSVNTGTTQSDGGDISIRTGSLLHLKDGSVTTSVQGGEGTGGNISVSDSEFLVMNRSHIKADAHGGDGGSIFIGAEHFLASAASSVTASSALRNDGEITILSPEEDISGSLTSLPQNLMDASRWASTPCRLRSGEDVSRFILGLRDMLPESPDDLFPSPPRKTGIPEADEAYRSGNYPELIRICGKILSDTEIPLSPEQHTDILMLTASAYQAQGHLQKALTVYDSLHNIIPGKDAGRKALHYAALADAYLVSGKTEKAEEFSERAEIAAELISDPFVTARVYNHLGNIHTVEAVKNRNRGFENIAGQSAEKAEDYYRRGLGLVKTGEPGLKTVLMINTARFYLQEKKYADAQDFLRNAIKECEKTADSHEKAWILLSAGTVMTGMSGYASANPTYGSLMPEILETAAHTAENTGDTRTASLAYGYLGNFYEQKGEHEKALSLTRRALFGARQSGATEIIYQWEGQAGRIFRSLKKEEDALSAYRRAVKSLNPGCENDDCPPVLVSEMFRGGFRIPKNLFTETVRPLYGELAELTVRKAENIRDESEKEKLLEKVLSGTESLRMLELQDFYQDECVTADQRRKAPDNRAFAETALLWPLLLPENPVMLVRLPDGLKMFPLPASSEEISGTAAKLAGELRKRESENRIQGYGARLYRYLIRPLEKELESRNIKTLVISPDGELRTVPFAVLYDGEKYLAEKYALATVPALSLTDTSARKETHSGVLLAGLSQETVLDGETFPPLPNVRTETEGIREIAGGKPLLDENFTRKNIGSELRQNSYSAVNFSTHGHFGGSAEDTFLLAYDGKIGPSDMETLIHISRFREEKTDLLTLSACETGVGDERAALGLGGAAVRTGVKTVLASLWKVDDESTSLLMTEFYRQARTGNVTMAEALRLSQMKLLAHPEYRHPYFWSAFLLIGNWR